MDLNDAESFKTYVAFMLLTKALVFLPSANEQSFATWGNFYSIKTASDSLVKQYAAKNLKRELHLRGNLFVC